MIGHAIMLLTIVHIAVPSTQSNKNKILVNLVPFRRVSIAASLLKVGELFVQSGQAEHGARSLEHWLLAICPRLWLTTGRSISSHWLPNVQSCPVNLACCDTHIPEIFGCLRVSRTFSDTETFVLCGLTTLEACFVFEQIHSQTHQNDRDCRRNSSPSPL